ncbi:hypothetical protein [Teredinibacter sp. KSP-S5-2]|uniref:hypothetical protein n=1 Tax=Teredinibacter sp. KSP-S5-2 TaxID=3034506 RepID=UPI0029345A16|nr:hypothetical protein [Teredinibacter sp. KSP-S5-2]WNO08791.1 hypothetical protein P5V12_17610 [Teredinibacter sp. KSP-S5-2]
MRLKRNRLLIASVALTSVLMVWGSAEASEKTRPDIRGFDGSRSEHRGDRRVERRRDSEHRSHRRQETRREHRTEHRRESRRHGHHHYDGHDLARDILIGATVSSHWGHSHNQYCDHKRRRPVKRGYYYQDRWGDCYWIERYNGHEIRNSVARRYCW